MRRLLLISKTDLVVHTTVAATRCTLTRPFWSDFSLTEQPDCGETPTRYVSGSTATSSSTTCDDEDNRASARRMRSRTSFQATDLTVCIICQTTQKKYKDKHLNESLSWCLTEQASATLLEAARIRSDERLLLAIEHLDLISIEVRYHRSCYSTYTHKQNLKHFIEARNESPVAPYTLMFMLWKPYCVKPK